MMTLAKIKEALKATGMSPRAIDRWDGGDWAASDTDKERARRTAATRSSAMATARSCGWPP